MMLSLSISKGQEQVDQFTGNNISMEDSFGELARKVLNTNINALNETFSMIREEDIERAITLIHGARKVFFFGVGASMLTAMKAMNKFMRIENKVFCIQDSHMQAMAAQIIAANSTCLAGTSPDAVSRWGLPDFDSSVSRPASVPRMPSE